MAGGLCVKQGDSPLPPQGNCGAVAHLSTCPPRAAGAGASSDILADASRCNSSFAAAQAKQVLLPEPKDCSRGEEQEEEQKQETPGSWISCSYSCSHPPSAAAAHASHSRAMGILFPSVGVTPPWLVPGAGFGHPQHCFEPATSEGNQT